MEEQELLILEDIRKCSKSVEKTTLETTAYLRALGESKGLNIAKFRDEVRKEMENDKGTAQLSGILYTSNIYFQLCVANILSKTCS